MALLTCPDCGKQFSSLAPACPECGRPVSTIQVPEGNHSTVLIDGIEQARSRRIKVAKSCRMARASLVFGIFCAVCGVISFNYATVFSKISLNTHREVVIMAIFTFVFYFASKPLSICAFFKRMTNKGGVSGVAIAGFCCGSAGLLFAVAALLYQMYQPEPLFI